MVIGAGSWRGLATSAFHQSGNPEGEVVWPDAHLCREREQVWSPHSNAPLTPEGRRRLCERIDSGRPLAHVADEGGVSRIALTKWYMLRPGNAG
jgi:hypothetical protein